MTVKFEITDDLPDLGNQVTREEILLLLTVAHLLSPHFAEAMEAASGPKGEGVTTRASSSIRPRKHAEAG